MACLNFTFDRFLSTVTCDTQGNLIGIFEALKSDKLAHAERVEKFKNSAEWNYFDTSETAKQLADEGLEQIRSEYGLRESLRSFYDVVEAERNGPISDAVNKTLESARTEIRKGLLALGYVEAPAGERSSLLPGMIESHPKVMAARNDVADVANDLTTNRRENESAMASLKAKLDELKQKSLAAIV